MVPKDVNEPSVTIRSNCQGSHPTSKYMKIYEFPNTEDQVYWNKCACNEYNALLRRHCLKDVPGFVPGNIPFKQYERDLLAYADVLEPLKVCSDKEVMKNTRPHIRKRYQRARNNLRANRVSYSKLLSRLQAFVKYEKIPKGKVEDDKPPRLIQFRSYEYLYLLKKHLLGYALQIKDKESGKKWKNGQPLFTIFTKTMDNHQTAQAIVDSWQMFNDPVAFCLDHSKFDGHYNVQLLKAEHAFWVRCFGAKPKTKRLLDRLLADQISQKGRTASGLSYKTEGHRSSGEYTTSDGNTVSNTTMLTRWCEDSGVAGYRLHVNGDDSVVMMERRDSMKMLPLSYFNNFNMETTLDIIADQVQQISYCQSSPIRVGVSLRWTMVKNPLRSLSRLQYCDAKFKHCLGRYRLGVGLCELAVSSGIPIMQVAALYIISDAESDKPLGSVDKYPARMSGNKSEATYILPETRNDFAIAFGIGVAEQHQYELAFAGKIRFTQNLKRILTKYKNFINN